MVSLPNSPCGLVAGPAAKYNVLASPAVLPLPNARPHSPLMTTGMPGGEVSVPQFAARWLGLKAWISSIAEVADKNIAAGNAEAGRGWATPQAR